MPTLEMEKTSESLHGPSVYQVENGINPQHDIEDPELPEPELQALDQEDATNKVEKKAVEDVSDRESEKGIEYEERYHIKTLPERKEKSKLRLLQTSHFFRLMEDRMAFLESEVSSLKYAKQDGTHTENNENTNDYSSECGDENDDVFALPKKPYRQIDEQDWKTFQGGDFDMASVVETLKGEVGVGKNKLITAGSLRHSVKGIVPGTSTEASTNTLAMETQASVPHRVKIHSRGIMKTLMKVTSSRSSEGSSDSFCTLVAPFKTLVLFETEIRDELNHLTGLCPDKVWGTASTEKGPKEPEVAMPQSDDQRGTSRVPHSEKLEEQNYDPGEKSRRGSMEYSVLSKEETKETLLAVAELRILFEFIDTRLKGILDVRRQIQDGTLRTISFSNLFLLFNPGDIVFAEEPKKQACKVFSTSGGLPLNRTKAAENRHGSHLNDLYYYNEHDVATPFIIDCYHLAFDGNTYGPLQKTFVIPYFAGEKQLRFLPICPEKFHARRSEFRSQLIKNGKLFIGLVENGLNFAHRAYEGWGETSKGDMEEIDSQVIIDFSATFRRYPKWSIKLGLGGATPQDPRQMKDCGDQRHHFKDDDGICVMCENDQFWPEDQIENLRSSDYLASVRDDLQTTRSARDLKKREDQLVLLPATIFGFALRSRKWVALNIENVRDLSPPEEAFDDLVIKLEHKRLVQALVKTHARPGRAFGKAFASTAEEYQADIVRGKGKGLIILLHGLPGVGKTSTAECVADLTGRPLFQITCGDIGTEPETVEKTLDENFLLAHRWECVLLLDEADVFLQERDRTNLKRNSLVSVFLRTLEYYSGILFLTTNREGTLDEAFKSRIHISLHYQRPNSKEWLTIWKNNMRRVSKHYDVDEKGILAWAKSNFQVLNWNGRQIRNAFQAATALAKFSALEEVSSPVEKDRSSSRVQLRIENFNHVADASIGFDHYLQSIYGLDKIEDRLLREKIRNDRFQTPLASNGNNLNPMYQPQASNYSNLPNTQQQNLPQYLPQQAPGAYHQPSAQYGRLPAQQHQQNVQGSIPFQNMDGNPNVAAPNDLWSDED